MTRLALYKTLASILGAGLLGFLSTTLAGPSDSVDDKAKALAKLDDDWSKVAGKRDLEGTIAFYADDAVIYPPDAPLAKGKEGARKVWGALFADPSASITWKTVSAEVAKSGEVGFTAGTYEFSMKGPDGKAVVEKGKYLCMGKFQKDGSWKASHDMWNADSK